MPRSQIFASKLFIALIIVLAIAAFSFALFNFEKPVRPSVPFSTSQAGASDLEWITVYFTNPDPPDDLEKGIDLNVVPAMDAAKLSIDAASFDFNLPSVIDALVRASRRGVKVRVVYDGLHGNLELENASTNYQPVNTIETLKNGGVSLVNGGRSNGLMHNKMIIVDDQTLFVGSWNLSFNDTYRNNNNLLKITARPIIANYQAKFNELFIDQKFGARAVLKAQVPTMRIGDTLVENYFSPPDHVMDQLIQHVRAAQKSIHFLIFTYTDEDLVAAMIAQAKAGVDVQGVIEGRCTSPSALASLSAAKVPVKVDGNPYTMHHKVIIIDRETVITGSFNFTRSADTINDENVIMIHNATIAAQFEQEYQKISSAGAMPTAADLNCVN